MTQSASRPTVAFDLISTDIPVTIDIVPFGTEQNQITGTNLALFPDKLGDIGVRMQNQSNQELRLVLKVQGNFPMSWLRLNSDWQAPDRSGELWKTQPFLLQPKQSIQKTITFQISKQYFEEQTALNRQESLDLKYQGHVYLTTASDTSQERLVGYQPIDFYVQPICTYLDFLPEIYQQSDFLARALMIFEQAFDPTVQTMDTFWAYLDPLTAPKALLPFLAECVAWPMNPRWKLKLQRRLIRNAVEMYQWRGSKKGLRLALHLCTGLPDDENHIQVTDANEIEFTIGSVTLAQEPTLGGGKPFHFSVALRPASEQQLASIDETSVRSIIEQEKPAFCTYDLSILPPQN